MKHGDGDLMRVGRLRSAVAAASGVAIIMSGCSLPPDQAWREPADGGAFAVIGGRPHRVIVAPGPQVSPELMTGGEMGSIHPESSVDGAYSRLPADQVPVALAEIPTVPVGEPAPGAPGLVYSPYAPGGQLVNVARFAAGQEVLCPYTMRSFIVPDFQNIGRLGVDPADAGDLNVAPIREVASTGPMTLPELGFSQLDTPVDRIDQTLDEPAPGPVATGTSRSADPLPAGSPVSGRAGYVTSPWAESFQLVDVRGIEPGTEVKCPYTGKSFLVPEPAGASPAREPAPAPAAPESRPTPQTDRPAPESGEIPTASWAEGRPGYVQSPFAASGKLVNVDGNPPGALLTCPFSGKKFRVPPAPAAAAAGEAVIE